MPYSLPNTASTDSFQTWGNGIYTGGWLQVFDQTGVTGGGGIIAYVSHRPSGSSGPTADAEAVQLTPGWYPLIGTPRDPIVSVTFKSAITGKPAQVTGLLVEDGAAGFGSGTQISGSLSSTGSSTPVSGGGNVNGITGLVTSAGAITAGTGFTVIRTGAGTYAVTFTTPFAVAPMFVASVDTTLGVAGIGYQALTAGSVTVQTYTTAGVSGDRAFSFLALTIQ
jgi:hypothetical protein